MNIPTTRIHRLAACLFTAVLAISVSASASLAHADESISASTSAKPSTVLSLSSSEEGIAPKNLPSSFDLRDVDGRGYVTPVKFQNPFGTCWGFAAIAAAETSVLGSHFADDPNAYKTLDFSEKQIAFFTHTHIEDPANSQNGKGTYVTKYQIGNDSFVLNEPLEANDYYNTAEAFSWLRILLLQALVPHSSNGMNRLCTGARMA